MTEFSNHKKRIIAKPAKTVLFILLVIVALLAVKTRFTDSWQGDEYFYVTEVERVKNNGIWKTINEGTSHLFVVLSSTLSFVTGDTLFSNRLLSLLSLILVINAIIGIANIFKINRELKWLLLITVLTFAFDPFRSPFLFGINDTLMFGVISQSIFYLVKYLIREKTKYAIIAAILIGIGFWIREITLIYITTIAFASLIYLITIIKKRAYRHVKTLVLFFLIVFTTATIPHLPALINEGTFAFEDKNYMGNWREREYLTQLKRIPSGSVFSYERVSWEEVEAYKAEGLKPYLPQTRFDILRSDPKMVIDSFSSNLLIRSSYLFLFRNGVFFILFIASFWLWKEIRKRKNFTPWILIVSVISLYTIIISAITIHRIEIRWMGLVIILMAFAGAYILDVLEKKRSIYYKPLVMAQYIFIALSLIRIVVLQQM